MNCFTQSVRTEVSICELQEVATNTAKNIRFRRILALVDSGAAANVLPADLLEDYPALEGEAKRNGTLYTTADGNELPGQGEKMVPFRTRESHQCAIRFQVADVKRPLLSVSALMSQGNRVIFDDTGGTITTKDGSKSIRFHLQNGIYLLEMCVPPFRGQGK